MRGRIPLGWARRRRRGKLGIESGGGGICLGAREGLRMLSSPPRPEMLARLGVVLPRSIRRPQSRPSSSSVCAHQRREESPCERRYTLVDSGQISSVVRKHLLAL